MIVDDPTMRKADRNIAAGQVGAHGRTLVQPRTRLAVGLPW